MDIREPHSLFSLFIESFRLANRSFGMILGWLVSGVLIGAIFTAFIHFFPLLGVLATTLLMYPLIALMYAVLIKILASRALNDNTNLSDMFASSILPTIYLTIFWVLGSIALFFLSKLQYMPPQLPWYLALPVKLFLIYLTIRLLFLSMAIVLRDQDPISALSYTWDLTGSFMLRSFITWFLPFLCLGLCLRGIFRGLYVGIPTYFADSFDLANLSPVWWGVLGGLAFCYAFVCLSMLAFRILVFLNMDLGETATARVASLPDVQAVTETTQLEEGVPLQLSKTSVKTQPDTTFSQELDQVYTPMKEDVNPEAPEEDRMPTIVFDNDVAQEIERNRALWEQEKANARNKKFPDEEEHSSIKISR